MTFTSWISKASLWMCLYGTLWINPEGYDCGFALNKNPAPCPLSDSCARAGLIRSLWEKRAFQQWACWPLGGIWLQLIGHPPLTQAPRVGFLVYNCFLYFKWSSPCHSIWYSFRHSIGRLFWHTFRHSIVKFFSVMLSGILLWNSFWHSFWHFIWHLFWHSVWHSFWHSGPGVPHSVRSWRYGARRSLHSAERRRSDGREWRKEEGGRKERNVGRK